MRSPALQDGFLWSVIFEIVARDEHPWSAPLLDALRDPLPGGFAAVAYLDFANTIARAGNPVTHPFDTTAGRAQLQAWLTDPDVDRHSYAHSAAASIPFLSPEARKIFLQLADRHPDHNVRFEAAWGAALRGDERGLETLQAACADPRHAARAMSYLCELGAQDRIPVEATSPDFQALAEMCTWLAHPNEYGRPPSEIRQVDARELFWPPTSDRRRLRVFRFEYPRGDGDQVDVGHGLVGSVTFALAGENTAALSAEEVYGLHCAWELAMNHDDRAPEQRTAAAGIEILRTHNPEFARG